MTSYEDVLKKIIFYTENDKWYGRIKMKTDKKDDLLKPCKFCGSNHQNICSEGSPYYFIRCRCGVEMFPTFIDKEGQSYDGLDFPESTETLEEAHFYHKLGLTLAVNTWNRGVEIDLYNYRIMPFIETLRLLRLE